VRPRLPIAFLFRSLMVLVQLIFAISAKAQLCSGSLGDPAVNITFGSGGNSNTGFTPTGAYTYTSSSCPDDGFYTITNRTSGCFGNSWLTLNADHTGNGGAFMLVNASYNPGDFFVTTVTDLCPNTNYEFAAWIANVLARSGIKPNITFRIETPGGTILQQYSTGDIPESPQPSWKKYGFYFTTPLNSPVIVLRMTNNAPGGIGNDLALDDITFRPCSASTVTAERYGGGKDTVNICEGNSSEYTFTSVVSSGFATPLYQWQQSTDSAKTWKDISGANDFLYYRKPTNPGVYSYRFTVIDKTAGSSSCRISSNILVISVHPTPYVEAGANRILIWGDSVKLNAVVTGENPAYFWNPPAYLNNNKLLTPFASPPADTRYTLFVESAFGCKNKDDLFIEVAGGIFVPTIFTPNNDGINDQWRIRYLDPVSGAAVNVYDRFGRVVYHVEGQQVDWDGKYKGVSQPPGTYVYTIKFIDGRPPVKGTILIIR
jgi:gliding motility-associated-like protein